MEDNKKILWFYLRIIKHITEVMKNVSDIVENSDVIEKYNLDVVTIFENVLKHDRTKFIEPQLSAYIEISWKYYVEQKDNNEKYPLNDVLSSNATMLHIVNETHHPEHWDQSFLVTPGKLNLSERDNLPEVSVNGTSMPLENILEMVCDWTAVSNERGNKVRKWYEMNNGKRWIFTDEQQDLIEYIIDYFENKEDKLKIKLKNNEVK